MNSALLTFLGIINLATLFGYFASSWWGKLGGSKWCWLWCLIFTATCWPIDMQDVLDTKQSMVWRVVLGIVCVLWTYICAREIINRFFAKKEVQ